MDHAADRGVVVIADLKPYPTMKDSGVEWLGEVPAHWEVPRSKLVFEATKELARPDDVQLSATQAFGVIPQDEYEVRIGRKITKIFQHLEKRRHVEIDDFVISMRSFEGGLERAWATGCIRSSYVVLRAKMPIAVGYYAYAFKSQAYIGALQSTANFIRDGQDLNYANFCSVDLPFPPLAEQIAIARYLDYVDRRVRRLVRAKRRLIALLNEQKQAIIHRAVTRGLDPDVPLKDSGVEWLGQVPAHWEVRRLKTLCSMKSGDGITSMSIEPSGAYPVYGGNGIRGYAAEFTHDGDFVLIGRQGALCGNVHIARGRFWASEHAVVTSLGIKHSLEWFALILEVMHLNQYSIAAAQPGLAVERVLNLWMPVPPRSEQDAIAGDIANSTAEIEITIARASREIELLNEYRTRLVADVVTGKLDVRDAAAALPEVDPLAADDEPADALDTGTEADLEEPEAMLAEA